MALLRAKVTSIPYTRNQFVPDLQIFLPSKEINVNPKRRYLYPETHGVTRDKTGILRFSGVPRGGWGVQRPPPPEIPKALQNRAKLNLIVKTVENSEFRTPTPQDVREKRH